MAQGRGRPRHKGVVRYPGGQVKPAGPNERVLSMRLALVGDANQISKAESALDVALVRGWISEDRHRAARTYARLWSRHSRHVLGVMPGMKVSQGPSGQSAPVPVADPEAPMTSGARTPADVALAAALADLQAGRIDERAYGRAERAHRAAKIDWSRLPSAEVAAIFTAALDLENSQVQVETDHARDQDLLWRIWHRLSRRQAQELFAITVLDAWPQWVTLRAQGKTLTAEARQEQRSLELALDVVIHESAPVTRTPEVVVERVTPTPSGPKRVERTEYVDPEGNLLYEVERRVRPTAPPPNHP